MKSDLFLEPRGRDKPEVVALFEHSRQTHESRSARSSCTSYIACFGIGEKLVETLRHTRKASQNDRADRARPFVPVGQRHQIVECIHRIREPQVDSQPRMKRSLVVMHLMK